MGYQIVITEETSANIIIDNNTTNVSITTNEYPITIEYNAVIEQAGANTTYGDANVRTFLASGTNTGNIITSANVAGAFILGNGSQLTGLPASYSDANVVTLLGAFGSNTISTTGNVTGGNIIGNGSRLTNITGANVTGTVANASYALTANAATYAGFALTAGTANSVAGANVTGTVANASYALTANAATYSVQATYAGTANSVAGANVSGTVANATYALTANSATYATQATFAGTANAVAGANVSGTVANATYALTANAATYATQAVTAGTANAVAGANVSGTVGLAQFVTQAAQANITSVGTLTGLDVTNTANVGTLQVNNSAVITGNLTVNGTTTTINSNTVTTNDKAITLGNNQSTGAALDGAGIDVGSNSLATWRYNNAGNAWVSNINVTATGNVSGTYILGNGSLLTGIAASYGNAEVAANLAAFANNPITTTGNITAGYFFGNGSGLTDINAANIVGAYGNANVSNFLGNGFGSNTIVTTGNITTGNLLTGGQVSATGNVTGGNIKSAVFQAVNSAGGTLKNASGTTQASWGAGGGDNFAISVSTNINGANAQIDISPNGNSGHVHIKPTGTPSVEIAPTYPGSINNMVIGNITPLAVSATTVSASGNVTGNYFIGNGSLLTSITGANVSGTVPLAQFVTGNAQGNITSVGTLSSLAVTGNVSAGNLALTGGMQITGNIVNTAAVNKQVAFVGNGTISTDQAKFGSGSALLDGTANTFIQTAASGANLLFTTSDWTIEMFVYPTANIVSSTVFYDIGEVGSSGDRAPQIAYGSGNLIFSALNTDIISAAATVTANAWNHIAAARSSGNTKLYLNGVQVGSTYADTINYNEGGSGNLRVGSSTLTAAGSGLFTGYVDEVRISNGIGRYTGSTYTVPVAPFSADTYTSLLLHCNGSDGSTVILDSSSTSNVTVNDNLVVTGDITFSGLIYGDGSQLTGITAGGTPGGANTYVQFNDASAFGGTAGMTFDKTSNALSVTGNVSAANFVGNIPAAGSNTQIQFNNGGVLGSNANLTYNQSTRVMQILGNLDMTLGNITSLSSLGFGFGGTITGLSTLTASGNIQGGNLTATGAINQNSSTATNNLNGSVTILGQSRLGSIVTSSDQQFATATTGSFSINRTQGETQFCAPTGNITIGQFNNFLVTTTASPTQRTSVDLIIKQGATPYTVTLPTGNAQIKYAGNVSTVGTTANAATIVNISCANVASAALFLVTVSSEFV